MRAKVIVALTFLSFSVLSSGQAGTQKLLYTFTGGEDGGQPYQAGVIFDQAGNLYGVTEYGGAYNKGTVYQLTPSPSGPWTENVLYSFTGGTDGARPQGGLAIDGAGNLYGTTSDGGVPNVYCGTVFSLSPSESGWTFTILHTFTGGKDGCSPQADVMYSGLVYGTAAGDGCSGNGTLFWMTTSGGGYRANCFEGTTGWYPGGMCGCAVGLCGTSYFGGTQQSGNIWQQGMSGSYLPASLHSFSEKGKVGWAPVGDLTSQDNEWAASGNVYGTTSLGGTGGGGAVYLLAEELTRRGWVWTISALHDFPASPEDGSSPWAGVALDAEGNVYGTTLGGPDAGGTVFKLTPGAKNNWTESVLYSFTGGSDGGVPTSGVVLDTAGNLYGTTSSGGIYDQGVVYEVTPPTATTTTLTSSPNPSTHGQAVTFTAVVASGTGVPPNGATVSFMKGAKVLGTGSLTSGSASFTTAKLPVGTDSITATYGGDSNFGGSTSNPVAQVVENPAD